MKRTVFAAALLAAPLASADPGDSKPPLTNPEATTIIQAVVDDAITVLKDPALQGPEQRGARHNRLREISSGVFDWTEMAQRSLGVHWRKLDDAQRERFTKTFRELLASHYLGQMDRFQGEEKVVHVATEPTNEGFVVKMKLITPSRSWVPIDFFMDQERQVYDVAIEGVSLANHYRGSFDRMLVNNSFDVMMARLERKLAVQRRMLEKGPTDASGTEPSRASSAAEAKGS